MNNGKSVGQVRVTVQEVDRLMAITELARAINKLATALSATPFISIRDNIFHDTDPAIQVDTDPDVRKTMIYPPGGES
jgi:hypothetical protein